MYSTMHPCGFHRNLSLKSIACFVNSFGEGGKKKVVALQLAKDEGGLAVPNPTAAATS